MNTHRLRRDRTRGGGGSGIANRVVWRVGWSARRRPGRRGRHRQSRDGDKSHGRNGNRRHRRRRCHCARRRGDGRGRCGCRHGCWRLRRDLLLWHWFRARCDRACGESRSFGQDAEADNHRRNPSNGLAAPAEATLADLRLDRQLVLGLRAPHDSRHHCRVVRAFERLTRDGGRDFPWGRRTTRRLGGEDAPCGNGRAELGRSAHRPREDRLSRCEACVRLDDGAAHSKQGALCVDR